MPRRRAVQTIQGLKRRIASAEGLGTIISSQKTLSAAALGHYEKARESMARYVSSVELGICAALDGAEMPVAPATGGGRTATIIIGSDLGLVGRFNRSLAEAAAKGRAKTSTITAVGRNMAAKLAAIGLAPAREIPSPASPRGISAAAARIMEEVAERGGEVEVFHNARAAGGLKVEHLKLFPITPARIEAIARRPWPTKRIPMIAGERATTLDKLLVQMLWAGVYSALAGSLAAEHYQRLLTMQNAEKNIDERLAEMRREYAVRRQAEITEEMLDAVNGAEALGQSGQ